MATKLQIARARARVSLAEVSGKELPTEVAEIAKLDFSDAEDMTHGPAAQSSTSKPGIEVPAVWEPLLLADRSALTVHDMSDDVVDTIDVIDDDDEDRRPRDPYVHAWIDEVKDRYTSDIEHKFQAGGHDLHLLIDLKGMYTLNDDRAAGTSRRIRSKRS